MCIYFNIMWHQTKDKVNTFGDIDPYKVPLIPENHGFVIGIPLFAQKNIFCAGGFQ